LDFGWVNGFNGCLVGWMIGWFFGWLVGCMVVFLVSGFFGGAGDKVGWLVG